jgi:hypothetical protein
MMTALYDLATVFRSKNAGPFQVTVDLMFADDATYRRVVDAGVVTPDAVARRYGVDPEQVRVVPYPGARAVKVTLPRLWGRCGSGSPGDRDVYGAQQHGPLMDLEVP